MSLGLVIGFASHAGKVSTMVDRMPGEAIRGVHHGGHLPVLPGLQAPIGWGSPGPGCEPGRAEFGFVLQFSLSEPHRGSGGAEAAPGNRQSPLAFCGFHRGVGNVFGFMLLAAETAREVISHNRVGELRPSRCPSPAPLCPAERSVPVLRSCLLNLQRSGAISVQHSR